MRTKILLILIFAGLIIYSGQLVIDKLPEWVKSLIGLSGIVAPLAILFWLGSKGQPGWYSQKTRYPKRKIHKNPDDPTYGGGPGWIPDGPDSTPPPPPEVKIWTTFEDEHGNIIHHAPEPMRKEGQSIAPIRIDVYKDNVFIKREE